MLLTSSVRAQSLDGLPILAGGGKQTISPRDVEALRKLVRTFRLPADSTRLWMLWRDGRASNASIMVDVYLWPQVLTPRLVRGSMALCSSDPADNSWYPESPIVGGWTLTNPDPSGYALVAPPDRPFNAAKTFDKPFGVSGDWSDEDLVAVVDAMTLAAPEQQIQHLHMTAPGQARVSGVGVGKTPDGRRPPNFWIDFEKGEKGWKVTNRIRWVN